MNAVIIDRKKQTKERERQREREYVEECYWIDREIDRLIVRCNAKQSCLY